MFRPFRNFKVTLSARSHEQPGKTLRERERRKDWEREGAARDSPFVRNSTFLFYISMRNKMEKRERDKDLAWKPKGKIRVTESRKNPASEGRVAKFLYDAGNQD